jgi:ATP-dependent DNA ligase
MIPMSILFESIEITPQLCYEDINEFIKKTNNKELYWSPKIDGVRCWVVVNKNVITYFSRNGKEFFNFSIFDKEIMELINGSNIKLPTIFDSEVTSTDKKFHEVMTQIRRLKNIDTSKLRMHIFNLVLRNQSFKNTHSVVKYIFRGKRFKYINYLPYQPFNYTPQNLEKLVNDQVRKGYEGVVLQYGSAKYQFGKRTRWCCKVKKMKTIDLKVIDINMGKKGSKIEGMMATFIVDYKGKRLPISGRLSHKQREEYAKNPPIGKYIEIQYQEETKDGSLRIPVFVRVRDDK